ncbi:MAG: sulfite exporter TauE/SafE family protein, partial [Acidimicrobiales bacterium]
ASTSDTATTAGHRRPALLVTVLGASVYGGFFGAGLGIMLLALLGLFSAEPLAKVNAVKQALSFVINLVAAVFFFFSGQVRWELVPVMAAASIVGGIFGGRLVRVIDADFLRRAVVVAGVAVAVVFWLR